MSKLHKIVPTLFVGVIALAQQAPPTAPSGASFRLSGTVVNAVTGQPLKDIEVGTGPVGGRGGQKTKTDSLGHFSFEGLSKGKFWLVAQSRQFPQQTFNQHEGFSTAIVVGNESVSSEGLVFRLHPGASISGTITDNFNDAVRNASVMLFRTDMSSGNQATMMVRQLSTDDQGHYRFSHLSAGKYVIAVSASPWYAQYAPRYKMVPRSLQSPDGSTTTTLEPVVDQATQDPLDVAYPITFYPGTTEADSATVIAVKFGDEEVADLILSAVPAVHLRIPTTSQEGISAVLQRRVFGNFSLPVQTRSQLMQREIEISGIAPGQFTLEMQTGGPNPTKSSQEISVYKTNGEIDRAPSLPSLTVRGFVTLDGEPLGKTASVHLRNQNNAYESQLRDKGEFQVAGPVNAGIYDVTIFDVQGGGVIHSITRDALPAVEGNKIALKGSGATQLDIKLTRELGKVEGTAMKNGKPFAGAMVILVPDDFEHHPLRARRDQSDSDGTFTLARALPGKYKVIALENAWDLEWANPAVLKPYLKAAQSLEVAANQSYTVKIEVQ